MSDTTIVVCAKCSRTDPPTTTEGWIARQCVAEEHGSFTHWRCPLCNDIIYTVSDYGTLDFGIEPVPQ